MASSYFRMGYSNSQPNKDMNCCGRSNNTSSKSNSPSSKQPPINHQENTHTNNMIKHELLLKIPSCVVHLVEDGESVELDRGEFSLYVISDQSVPLATIIKVVEHLQWPVTKDEPVVKIDELHYLFTLPMRAGDPLNYGVTFSDRCDRKLLRSLDSFLREHSCFSSPAKLNGKNDLDWKEFAPKVAAYNSVLARAIAGGTGHIVKGIFTCSNAYTNQVQKGGELMVDGAAEGKKNYKNISITQTKSSSNYTDVAAKNAHINQSIKRVRKLSDTTEKMSKAMLNGVGIATGSVMGPLVNSKHGKAFFSMMPGEVLLASLDALDKIMNAAEAAERQTLRATSEAAGRIVSNRYGEDAGEATQDVLATAGHCAGTAWNIMKIRRAINPTAAAKSGMLKNSAKTIKY